LIVLAVGGTYMGVPFASPSKQRSRATEESAAYVEQSKRQTQEKTTQLRQVKQTDEIAVEKYIPHAMTKGALLQPADPKKPKPAYRRIS